MEQNHLYRLLKRYLFGVRLHREHRGEWHQKLEDPLLILMTNKFLNLQWVMRQSVKYTCLVLAAKYCGYQSRDPCPAFWIHQRSCLPDACLPYFLLNVRVDQTPCREKWKSFERTWKKDDAQVFSNTVYGDVSSSFTLSIREACQIMSCGHTDPEVVHFGLHFRALNLKLQLLI